VTRLFDEAFRNRVLRESDARVVVMYGQVTDVDATVLAAWEPNGDADEERSREAFGAAKMLEAVAPVYFIHDVAEDPFLDAAFAQEKSLKSAALFRLEMKNQLVIVAFGFTTDRDFSRCGAQLYSLAAQMAVLAAAHDCGHESLTVLAQAMEGIAHALESTSSLEAVLETIGKLLHQAFEHWNLQAQCSFFVLAYKAEQDGARVVPRLRYLLSCGRHPQNASQRQLDFDQGVVGWVAKHRAAVNVLRRRGRALTANRLQRYGPASAVLLPGC
jgi:hypothetical protein